MRTIVASTLLVMLAAGPVVASNQDRPAKGDISIEEARNVAERDGYSNIGQIEFDDGHWEIEALDANGRKVEIDINAASGKIVEVDRD